MRLAARPSSSFEEQPTTWPAVHGEPHSGPVIGSRARLRLMLFILANMPVENSHALRSVQSTDVYLPTFPTLPPSLHSSVSEVPEPSWNLNSSCCKLLDSLYLHWRPNRSSNSLQSFLNRSPFSSATILALGEPLPRREEIVPKPQL